MEIEIAQKKKEYWFEKYYTVYRKTAVLHMGEFSGNEKSNESWNPFWVRALWVLCSSSSLNRLHWKTSVLSIPQLQISSAFFSSIPFFSFYVSNAPGFDQTSPPVYIHMIYNYFIPSKRLWRMLQEVISTWVNEVLIPSEYLETKSYHLVFYSLAYYKTKSL